MQVCILALKISKLSAFSGGTARYVGETKNPRPKLANVLAKFYIFVPLGPSCSSADLGILSIILCN